MTLKRMIAWPVLVLGLSLPALVDCSAAKDLQEAASGCDELNGGASAVASANVDIRVKAFMQATVDLQTVANELKTTVKASCIKIATDLGATDTWTADSSNNSISNDQHTGACDVAAAKITAALSANGSATLTVMTSGGECHIDADAQVSCEGSCDVSGACQPGSVEVRCDPGQLSAVCDAECKGGATCEGTLEAQADCTGTCDAQCTGTCTGACTGTVEGGCSGMCDGKCDGQATPAGGMANCTGKCEGKCTQPAATAMCSGKCEASCQGKCSGSCKLDATANVKCGAMVSCKGGCTTTFTAPKCEGELMPPSCNIDANCQASCKSRASCHAQCEPLTVQIVASVQGNAQIDALVATLQSNLPAIWVAAKTKGKLAFDALASVASTGAATASAVTTAGGHAFACATAAVSASASAAVDVKVSVSASASVSGSATGGAG